MKLELDIPTWYSQEAMYSSPVKTTDFVLETDCIDFSNEGVDIKPSEEITLETRKQLIPILVEQTKNWFTTPLTAEQIEKRLVLEFPPFSHKAEQRWLKIVWKPYHFQVQRKGFRLIFKIHTFNECSPRIPLTFLEAMTPRATTPTEPLTREEVRNIVLQPGAGPTDLEQVDDIPLSENQGSFEIRDERAREKHRLRQAKLRAAIARLKVEEMRERYLRHYGGEEYLDESSDSESEDSSIQSELSEPVLKK
jgi:hypothetical protein